MHLRPSLARRLFGLVLVLILGLNATAMALPGQTAEPTAENQEVGEEQLQVADQLNKTLTAIETKRDQIKALKERLKTTQEGERAEVEGQIAEAEESLSASRDHFEALAVGGVSLGTDEAEKTLDWQTELLEIAKPLFSSLKALTDKPRTMDRLRTQIHLQEDNLELTDKALASLERTAASDLQPAVAARVDALQGEWQSRRETTVQDLDMLRFQLAKLEGESSFHPREPGRLGPRVSVRPGPDPGPGPKRRGPHLVADAPADADRLPHPRPGSGPAPGAEATGSGSSPSAWPRDS